MHALRRDGGTAGLRKTAVSGRCRLITLLLCFIVFSVFAPLFARVGLAFMPSPRERCPVCGMFVAQFARWNATIEFADAKRVIFDGNKCMFKYYLEIKKYDPAKSKADLAAITVKDYFSQDSVAAEQAFYVIWSNVYGPMGHEPLSFAREADAKKFLKEHKGLKILRLADITPQVIFALDNP